MISIMLRILIRGIVLYVIEKCRFYNENDFQNNIYSNFYLFNLGGKNDREN
jgi:hypothetical protein